MDHKTPEKEAPPKVHDEGETIWDAMDNRDLDAIDAECRGLDLVQPIGHYYMDPDTGQPQYALSKAGVEEAGRLGGGVDCPKAGLTVDRDDEFWHAEQEGISLTSKLRRTGSASAKITNRYGKPDRFGRRKAISLAQRNAISALLTLKQRAEMIDHAIKIGSVEQIDPPWKKKDSDSRHTGQRPPAGKAPRKQSSRRPTSKHAPTREEAIDYLSGILGEIISDARPEAGREERRDCRRAVIRRATGNGFNNAEEMPLAKIVGVIRKIERDRDAVADFLRGDEWKQHLGFEAPTRAPAADAEGSAPEAGEGDAGTTPPPPTEAPEGGQETPPVDDTPDPVEGPDEAVNSPSGSPTEPETPPEDADARAAAADEACEAILAVVEAIDLKPIAESAEARERTIQNCRTAMTRAVIRAGTGKEAIDELTIDELKKLAARVTRDNRAITRWLTSGRYLTGKGPAAAEARLSPQKGSTTTTEDTRS